MADFWIKIEKGTPDKPEILELASALGIPDPDTVTGKMIRVWAWFDSNSANGHAPSVTNVLLDRLTGVTGFTDALVTVGWLDKTDDGFLIPNFDRHLGKNAKKRALDTERKRKSRNLSQECPAPNVTKKGLDKSRVDKSRVENKKQHKLNTCSTQDEQNPTNQEPITKNQEPRTNIKNNMSSGDDRVTEIFDYWIKIMEKSEGSTKLTPKRKKAITARLKDGYSIAQIKSSIDGCKADPFSMGANDRQKPFNDIELICRTGEKLESFFKVVTIPTPRPYQDVGAPTRKQEFIPRPRNGQ